VRSDAALCVACNASEIAFTPDRLLPSFTEGWPEIISTTIAEAAAFIGLISKPNSILTIAISSVLSTWHFIVQTWAYYRYLKHSPSAPWMLGHSWVLIIFAWLRILREWNSPDQPMSTSADGSAVEPGSGRRVGGQHRWKDSWFRGFLVFFGGFQILACIPASVTHLLLIYTVTFHGKARTAGFDLERSIPLVCNGHVPRFLPPTYRAQANQAWLAEVILGWAICISFTVFAFRTRGEGKLLLWCGVLAIVWFIAIKPWKIATSVMWEKQGNVVLNFGPCCVVLPNLMYGAYRDRFGWVYSFVVKLLGLV
jgi:hypothetical protein